MKASRPNRTHDEAVIEMLKEDPDFANEYLATALEEVDQAGGQKAVSYTHLTLPTICSV